MNARLIATLTVATTLAVSARGAEPVNEAKKSRLKDAIVAQMIEEAKKAPPPPAKEETPATTAAAPATAAPAPVKDPAAKEAAAVLPKVEVRRDRITELDRQLALQDMEIAREKAKTQPTELDKALNDPRVATPLAIFGGESAQHRASMAQERVSLMESEKDLIQAIAMAKTKEEKAELQKQLDQLKAYRRELEQSLR